MAKKGGDTTVKRQLAPSFWKIGRKEGRFVVRARPGPHPKRLCYPLGILLRDVLKLGNNMEEVRSMVNEGKIAVDGVVRRSIGWSVGLMDVIELIPLSKAYRLVPKDKALLVPVPLAIPGGDAGIQQRVVERKEHPRILIQGVGVTAGHPLGEHVPMPRRGHRPGPVGPVLGHHLAGVVQLLGVLGDLVDLVLVLAVGLAVRGQ